MVTTKIYAGSQLLLDVVANVRPGVSASRVRPGVVYSTPEGPFVQYGPPADNEDVVEVHIQYAGPAEVATVRAMARGDYGDVFRIEGPRETIERAALMPGREGVAIDVWPSPAAQPAVQIVLRFVRV